MEIVNIKDWKEKNDGSTECVGKIVQQSDVFVNRTPPASPDSILTMLDDKNRSITCLKQQIQNQKLQLGYYLNKRLSSSPQIMQLAETCIPTEAQENLPVNMAMTKFYAHTGLKSKLMSLYERMKKVERRTLQIIAEQEEMIKRIVHKLAEISQRNSYARGGIVQFALFHLKRSCGTDVLSEIVGSTNRLRKELDTFRVCCNRLILIEDERNTLVEQVYSMPVAKRMNYSVVLAAQYEKMRLEKEVEEIKRDQEDLHRRLATVSPSASGIQNGHCIVRTSGDQCLNRMVNAVNAEAVSLLTLAKHQTETYLEEISKLQEVNDNLTKQLSVLKDEVAEKDQLNIKLENLVKENETLQEQYLNKLNEMHCKYRSVVDENKDLSRRLEKYKDIEEQVEFLRTQIQEMNGMRRQRDYYKAQVDDLQAIRSAYAQLVEQLPQDEEKKNTKIQKQARKIEELENQNNQFGQQKQILEGMVADQESQIRHLLIIIEKLVYTDTKESSVNSKLRLLKLQKQRDKKNHRCKIENYTEMKDDSSQTDQTTQILIDSVCGFDNITKDKAVACSMSEGDCETVHDISNNEIPFDYISDDGNQTDDLMYENQVVNISNCVNMYRSDDSQPILSTASVKVQTTNRQGKCECVRALLESYSPIEGTIRMDNNTALTLRLTCTNNDNDFSYQCSNYNKPQVDKGFSVSKPLTTILSGQELRMNTDTCESGKINRTIAFDEFELMKDSSKETVPNILPSLHHTIQDVGNMKHQVFPCCGTVNLTNSQLLAPSLGILYKINDETKIIDCESDYNDLSSDNTKSEEQCLSVISSNIAERLKQITLYLDRILLQPEGKQLVLKSVQSTYSNMYSEGIR